MACYNVSLKGVEPKRHQIKVANYINKEKTLFNKNVPKALIVAHGVGTGKTITAILSAACFLKNNPGKKVLILTPGSVLQQFASEVKKLVTPEQYKNIYCYTSLWWLTQFKKTIIDIKNVKNPDKLIEEEIENFEEELKMHPDIVESEFILPDDNMLIIDEAHQFRTKTTKGSGNTYARLLNEAALRSNKVLLLTATPIVNSEEDLRNYLAIVNNRHIVDEYKTANSFELKDKKFVKNYVKCAFSYFKSDDHENYPEVKEHIVPIPMTEEYEKIYEKIQDNQIKDEPSLVENFSKDPIPFLNGLRKAVNYTNTDSPKIKWIFDKVQVDVSNNKKIVIYSALKDFGVNRIRDGLDKMDISCNMITGDTKKDKRFELMKEYNENKVPVLLISAAGAEGLDLKETRTLIILEPYWNQARIDQVKGRAIRYRSHANLPKDQRKVDVYTLVLTKRTPMKWGIKGISARLGNLFDNMGDFISSEKKIRNKLTLATADEILLRLSEIKTEKILEITDQIINGSIENNKC